MDKSKKEIDPLFAIIAIAFVSLIVAYITFGILGSTGAFTDEKFQLGGAVAGFFAVFWLIFRSYRKQMDKSNKVEISKLNEKLRKEKKPLYVVLKFNQKNLAPEEEIKDLEFEKSTLKIINDKNIDKESEPEDIILTPGGEQAWFFRQYDVAPGDIAILEIIDSKKRKWKSQFNLYEPYSITQELRRL